MGEAGLRVGDVLERCEEAACTAAVVRLDVVVCCFVVIERAVDTVVVDEVGAFGDMGCAERLLNCEDWVETAVVTEGLVVGWKVEWARKAEKKL